MRKYESPSGGVSIAKIIAYAAAIFLLAVFTGSFAAKFKFFGAVPSYLLVLTVAAGFFEGEKTGSVVGLASGFVSDALGGVGISVLPIFYTLLGWGIGRGVQKFGHTGGASYGERLLRWSIWHAIGCGVGIIITAVCLLLGTGKVNIFAAFFKTMLPEAFGSFIFGYPIGIVYTFILRNRN